MTAAMPKPRTASRTPRVDPVRTALERLADAQAETQIELRTLASRIEELAAAQRRTEQRVEDLAEAQRRTEERVGRLEAAIEALAQAQQRTEERLNEFVRRIDERLGRLETAVERLAEAQQRTEQAVERLAQQVGRLGETIGFTLEDLARDLTPDRLARRHGIQVDVLDRAFFRLDGQEVEIDLYGIGRRNGEQIAIVGEAKSRISGRDVEVLTERARQLASQLPGPPVPVLFGFVIHPSAREAASRLGAIVIASGG
jgi:predicted nuclease with TOPRIM domain